MCVSIFLVLAFTLSHSLTHSLSFSQLYKRIRCKLQAVAALQRLACRGHPLHTLEVAGCGLGPYALTCLAHALFDNHNLTSVVLSENAIGHSEYVVVKHMCIYVCLCPSLSSSSLRFHMHYILYIYIYIYTNHPPLSHTRIHRSNRYEKADNSALVTLLSSTNLQYLSLRNCGIFEHNLEAMVRALNKPLSPLLSVDLSGNHLGPTGANMIASVHNFFVDQLSLGVGFAPQVSVCLCVSVSLCLCVSLPYSPSHALTLTLTLHLSMLIYI